MSYSQLPTTEKQATARSATVNSRSLLRRATSLAFWALLITSYAVPWGLYARKGPAPDSKTSRFQLTVADVAITFKTGAKSLRERVPVHLELEFNRSLPNFQIYSDYDETIDVNGRSYDVLDIVKGQEDRFSDQAPYKHYLAQKKQLDNGNTSLSDLGDGWEMDKYKFLPLVGHAYKKFPGVKYLINVEDDTFLFLDNLLRWLSPFSHRGFAVYAHGNPTQGGVWFPYGGSGYVISAGLLDATYGRDFDGMLRCVDGSFKTSKIGDELLGLALFKRRPGVDLNGPDLAGLHLFATEPPDMLAVWSDTYCLPIMTMHHLNNDLVRKLHQLEQKVWPTLAKDDFIRRKDVFQHFMPDFLTQSGEATHAVQENWANDPRVHRPFNYIYGDPEVEKKDATSSEECSAQCDNWEECFMWQFERNKGKAECFVGNVIRPGRASDKATSGWRMDRVRAFMDAQPC